MNSQNKLMAFCNVLGSGSPYEIRMTSASLKNSSDTKLSLMQSNSVSSISRVLSFTVVA